MALSGVQIMTTQITAPIDIPSLPGLPFLGNLPGDLSFERGGVRVWIPIGTSIVVSILLTVVLNLALGLFGRR